VNRISRWRILGAAAVLGALVFLLAVFAPYYVRNLQLQNFVSGVTRENPGQTQSDEALRARIVGHARQLGLPVSEDNVQIRHMPDGTHIDVRYFVRVDLPGYTVDLHFYPGAGSR
jgi:hypothetical protein